MWQEFEEPDINNIEFGTTNATEAQHNNRNDCMLSKPTKHRREQNSHNICLFPNQIQRILMVSSSFFIPLTCLTFGLDRVLIIKVKWSNNVSFVFLNKYQIFGNKHPNSTNMCNTETDIDVFISSAPVWANLLHHHRDREQDSNNKRVLFITAAIRISRAIQLISYWFRN